GPPGAGMVGPRPGGGGVPGARGGGGPPVHDQAGAGHRPRGYGPPRGHILGATGAPRAQRPGAPVAARVPARTEKVMDLPGTRAYSALMTRDLADVLTDREHGFETDYFNQQDAKVIEKIRERARLQEVALALAEKLSVDEPALLERCVRLGFPRETGAALLLAPLVQMAWADGDVTGREDEVLLGLAASRGVVAGTPPYDLLLTWLHERPAADVFDTALDVLRDEYAVLPAAERAERIRALLEACHRVAEASRGLGKLLHFSHRVSAEESA